MTQQSVLALVSSRVAEETAARERGQRTLENALETARQEAAAANRRVKDELREHRNANTRVPMDVAALRRDVDSLQTLVQSNNKPQKNQNAQLGKEQARIFFAQNGLMAVIIQQSICPEIKCTLSSIQPFPVHVFFYVPGSHTSHPRAP